MPKLNKTLAALCLAAFGQIADATPIILTPTGLTSPDVTVTWSELVLTQGAPITNEYSAYGITFSPNTMFYNSQPGYFPSDPHAANFNFDGFQSVLTSLLFTAPVTGVAFNFITNAGTTDFTALLGGVVVETFNAATDTVLGVTSFYGFSGIVFDEIQILAPVNNAFEIDNIQIQGGTVPEPGSLALLGVGLVAAAFSKRRPKA